MDPQKTSPRHLPRLAATVLSCALLLTSGAAGGVALRGLWSQEYGTTDAHPLSPPPALSVPATEASGDETPSASVPAAEAAKTADSLSEPSVAEEWPSRKTKAGASIGTLYFPSMEMSMPIIQGTGSNDLEKGVGHYIGSVMPGAADNCVLSGHRDTVFRRLGELKEGDLVSATTAAGTFTYRVRGIRIVHKDDLTVIVPTETAVLTLITCYPFHYVGAAPERYVVSSDLVTGP